MKKISTNSDDNDKDGQIQNTYWIWLIAYMGIGLVASFIFPFPISLVVALLIFFLLNAVRTDIALRRQEDYTNLCLLHLEAEIIVDLEEHALDILQSNSIA